MFEQKKMHFANFNITFGEKDEPMLRHFLDVILPAFQSDIIRGNENTFPYFRFSGVEVKKILNEYVLVGNCIKVTEYVVRTVVKGDKLVSSPEDVPTAPYSRFIILLRNHRMVLVKNEPQSPDIRSFQSTVREILGAYIKRINNEKRQKSTNIILPKIPNAFVNIVDMPRKEDITVLLKNVKTIHELDIKFFTLNNDIDPTPLSNNIHEMMGVTDTKNAELKFKTPKSKSGVSKLLQKTLGLGNATTIMKVTDVEGKQTTYNEDKFSSNIALSIQADVSSVHDDLILRTALDDSIMKGGGHDHEGLFSRVIEKLKKITDKS